MTGCGLTKPVIKAHSRVAIGLRVEAKAVHRPWQQRMSGKFGTDALQSRRETQIPGVVARRPLIKAGTACAYPESVVEVKSASSRSKCD